MTTTEHQTKLLNLIDQSFFFLSGRFLPSPTFETAMNRIEWLHNDAPYALLAQNNKEVPNFIYVNKFAASCFKYDESEMLYLPSYLSAAPDAQAERNKILAQVEANNIAYNYTGVRITKFNETFAIHDGIIWKVFAEGNRGEIIGQAALFWLKGQQKINW